MSRRQGRSRDMVEAGSFRDEIANMSRTLLSARALIVSGAYFTTKASKA